VIYLASPYSDPDPAVREARFKSVCKVAARLIRAGYVVFCPIAHSHPLEVHGDLIGGWDFWALQDLPLLNVCNELHVAAFPGWEESEGVTAEIKYWEQVKHGTAVVYHHYTELP
jgi:hypothetical protein